jgi:hypothetical protein
VSRYVDALIVLRQVILLDERVRNTSLDDARIVAEFVDLRDRVSRLEGMPAAGMPLQREANPPMTTGCGHRTRRVEDGDGR